MGKAHFYWMLLTNPRIPIEQRRKLYDTIPLEMLYLIVDSIPFVVGDDNIFKTHK